MYLNFVNDDLPDLANVKDKHAAIGQSLGFHQARVEDRQRIFDQMIGRKGYQGKLKTEGFYYQISIGDALQLPSLIDNCIDYEGIEKPMAAIPLENRWVRLENGNYRVLVPIEGLSGKAPVYFWDISVVCEVTPDQFDAITSGRQQWSEVYLKYPGIKQMIEKVKTCSKARDRVFN